MEDSPAQWKVSRPERLSLCSFLLPDFCECRNLQRVSLQMLVVILCETRRREWGASAHCNLTHVSNSSILGLSVYSQSDTGGCSARRFLSAKFGPSLLPFPLRILLHPFLCFIQKSGIRTLGFGGPFVLALMGCAWSCLSSCHPCRHSCLMSWCHDHLSISNVDGYDECSRQAERQKDPFGCETQLELSRCSDVLMFFSDAGLEEDVILHPVLM